MRDLSNYEVKMRDALQFFTVKDDYIKMLKTIEPNICDNYSELRMHVGIVLEVSGLLYIAPLTSAGKGYLKENNKYKRIVYPIDGGDLGFIRIGNMIPYIKKYVCPIFIHEIEDCQYKNLIINQYNALSKNEVAFEIREKAEMLYTRRYDNDGYFLSGIMCNFKKIEKQFKNELTRTDLK